MSTYHWYKTCPHCDNQGRLLIQRNVDECALYLHCEECEWGWKRPEDATDVAKGFLTLLVDFESENPTLEEIETAGWGGYITGSFEA